MRGLCKLRNQLFRILCRRVVETMDHRGLEQARRDLGTVATIAKAADAFTQTRMFRLQSGHLECARPLQLRDRRLPKRRGGVIDQSVGAAQ
jgi:hypothetical protein